MTEIERYKKLKADLEAMNSKIIGLPGLIGSLKDKSTAARDEAVRLELLGGGEAANRLAAAKAAQDEIRKHEVEKEDLEHRKGIMQGLLKELREKAEAELSAAYMKAFAKALKSFSTAIREAHRAEVELAGVRQAAKQAFDEVDSAASPLPFWAPLLMREFGGEAMKSEVDRFFDSMKVQGYDVS